MIKSFANKVSVAAFRGECPRALPADIARVAARKLQYVHSAKRLDDLRSPPGNRLEMLRGDRAGRHSIRVNDQWRITFVWHDGDAYDVLVEDYH